MKENAPKKIRFQTLRTLWLPLVWCGRTTAPP